MKASGTSAFTAVTAPSGAIVGTSDTQTLTNKTLAGPKIDVLYDTTNSALSLGISAPASAANYIRITGATSGYSPVIAPDGETNVSLWLAGKGTGKVYADGAQSVNISDSQTLTNKRVTPRITTINAPGATPTIATDTYDQINYTGLAAAITSMTTNLTGTPTDGQKLMLRFKDNGTARAITWGASFTSSGVATLLATTVANKTHLVGLLYDSAVGDWIAIAVDSVGY